MYRKRDAAAWAAVAVGLIAGAAFAADNYFLPHGSNLWNVPANWSLAYCPGLNDNVHVRVTTTSHKTVEYNWSGTSMFARVYVDGSPAGYYAMIYQPAHVLDTDYLHLSEYGPAWYWMEGPAFLWVNDLLYVGSSGSATGYFHLNTASNPSAGVYVGDLCFIGYHTVGEFDHQDGYVDIGRLYIGQNASGYYSLQPGSAANLTVRNHAVIGNADAGTFVQTGGAFQLTHPDGFLILGLNTGGVGTYLMKGGTLDVSNVYLAMDGDAYFTQSGGAVTTVNDLNVGSTGTHPMRASYKLNEDDGPADLFVGRDLMIGRHSLAMYEQEAGTAVVAGNIQIWDGDPDPGATSYLHMTRNAGSLEATALLNHSGYFDQRGGVFEVWNGTNSSAGGMLLDNDADCRIRYLTSDAGTIRLYRNAILRGPLAGGGTYWICDFTNNAEFRMGGASDIGGSFRGHLTNNGVFTYYDGDFATSRLTNHGVINMYGDFTCQRLVNYAAMVVPTGRTLSANGAGYASAVENNSTLSVRSDGRITLLADKPLVNQGAMYAGGAGVSPATVQGLFTNNGFLLPGDSALPAGSQLIVSGGFTAGVGAELRIRLRGTGTTNYDRLTVQGVATLAGKLDVRLTDGYEPALYDTFYPVSWTSRSGQFSQLALPSLPAGLMWDIRYGTSNMRMMVLQSPDCPEDLDGDGQIGLSDLSILLTNFGAPGGPAEGDIDGDGMVGLADLSALLAVFGTMCP